MCFHQNRSLSTRAKGRGHTQQSQGRFHPECAISATAMRCVWPAGPRTISAHAGGTLFPGFQARVPFLPRLTSHGVMPTLQVEGLLREPGRHLSRFANFSFVHRGPPAPCKIPRSRPPCRPHCGGQTTGQAARWPTFCVPRAYVRRQATGRIHHTVGQACAPLRHTSEQLNATQYTSRCMTHASECQSAARP